MTDIDYAARVAKGAALLDAQKPGWERLLDLDRLEISDGTCCVTAQLSGVNDWHTGMYELGLTSGNGGTYVAHGFNAEDWRLDEEQSKEAPTGYDQDHAYATLNTLWKGLITERLSAGKTDG